MAQSPSQSPNPPIRQLQTVVDLLETPTLAQMYVYILREGPTTVSEIVAELNIPQGTAYDYIQKLETAALIENIREQRPYEYDTNSETISLTLSTDGQTQTITPALIAAVARRETNDDIDLFVERHGLDGLASALNYAYEYVDGTVNHRIAARELELSPLEAEIILQALESVASEYRDTAQC